MRKTKITILIASALVAAFILLPEKGFCRANFHPWLDCSVCHITYPYDYRTAQGVVQVCLSCHTGGSEASTLSLYDLDQASITPTGIQGLNHRWDASVYRVDIATLPTGEQITTTPWGAPLPPEKYKWKWTGDVKATNENLGQTGEWKVTCVSCHNDNTLKYYRNPEQRDKKICLNCHRIMKHTYVDIPEQWENIRTYTGKKMSHPVGYYGDSWIGCSTCHPPHGVRR